MPVDEDILRRQIIPEKLPRHVAIIMDGNGRWARARGLSRVAGHRAGVEPIRMVVRTAMELGIKFITLFAFSTENRKRPGREVRALITLLENFLKKEKRNLIKNQIRLKVIGDIEWFPESLARAIRKTVDITSHNNSLTLILALNYGGRQDIVQACRRISADVLGDKTRLSDIDETLFSQYLYTRDVPDPDLLIRTSNEYRISNFLLWQISYTELYITPVLWPDFSKNNFLEAIISFQNRKRRFGMV